MAGRVRREVPCAGQRRILHYPRG
ncbi:hypothetical protein FGF82_24390 [Salmonella sp. gx-f9]|nr:hypothetical protein [Salmonella sp. gx-f9]